MNVMGSKPMQGFASALGWADKNIPLWDQLMNGLDLLARGVKRTTGLYELSKARPIDKILSNLDNAWLAAEQAYRATPIQSLLPDELERELGVGATPEAWKFGTTTEAKLRPEQYGPEAIGDYFDRLNAGEKREILDKEFEDRYGMQGMYRDMVGMMVADPLNFIGGALAKGASSGIKASLKGTSIAQDAAKLEKLTSAVQKGGGVVDMLKRFTAASGLYLTYDQWNEIPRLVRFLTKPFGQPYTKTGALKVLELQKAKWRNLGGFLSPTRPTQARRGLAVVDNTLKEVMRRFGIDEPGLKKLRPFLVAMKNERLDDVTAMSMKMTDGADFGVLLAHLKDIDPETKLTYIDNLIKAIDDYELTGDMRKMWQSAVEISGKESDDLLKSER